jgi:hypothetical protein
MHPKNIERLYKMTFASVYPHYVTKVERKGKTVAELHQVIFWLTGYNEKSLVAQLEKQSTFLDFFGEAPLLNPNAVKIKGVICGDRIENIEDDLVRKVRYLDKLVDELANGKAIEKILRT